MELGVANGLKAGGGGVLVKLGEGPEQVADGLGLAAGAKGAAALAAAGIRRSGILQPDWRLS
jgi:hypothetical protein